MKWTLMDIYRPLYANMTKYSFFSEVHGIFFKTDHVFRIFILKQYLVYKDFLHLWRNFCSCIHICNYTIY